jgi:hypothetical protein
LRFVNAADPEDRDVVGADEPGQWTLHLPAGRSVRLACRY